MQASVANMASVHKITPVILSGGTGTRLWPLSRQERPKQFQALAGPHTLIQQSALRVSAEARFKPPIVIANSDHRFLVAEQLRAAGIEKPLIVLEPSGRNTAPAIAVAALLALREDPDALILACPADHVITKEAELIAAIDRGLVGAAAGYLTHFGVSPTAPATGYGYIRLSAPLPGADGVYRIQRFVEKPDLETARSFLASGDYVWNSGIFLLPARRFLEELETFEPEVLTACREAVARAARDADFVRLDREAFESSPSISVDHAVMERTSGAAVVPVDCGWTDVGSWTALWDIGEKDANGNVVIGDVATFRAGGSYLRTEGPLLAVIGVTDVVVVATGDAVLVASRDADQDVKALVEQLRKEQHPAR